MGICPNGTVIVDWGDNSATSTITGTSLTTAKYANHAYTKAGDYVITLTVSSGTFAIRGSQNASYILKKDTSTTANIHNVYSCAVKKVELGTDVSIGNYAFGYCMSLASVTIPNTVTSIGENAFYYTYSLASVTIPNGVTSIGNYTFYYTFGLSSVALSGGITSIGANAFYATYPLASVTIPNGVTSFGSNAFNGARSLALVTVPSTVTSIGNNAFSGCYGMAEYHIKPTSVPTLGTTAFNNIQSDCVIYVPTSKLSDYQTADNWSTYASHMVGE